jgi:NAD(P)-dependent dehydrogenase (short-subunit alcohol dehydrogenase family)
LINPTHFLINRCNLIVLTFAPSFNNKNKTMEKKLIALVTGVSREMGLGFEVSKQLAQQGYKVIMTARQLSIVETLTEQLQTQGLDVLPLALDITDKESVARAADYVSTQFGKLDTLVNNAGAYFDAGGDVLSVDLNYVSEALSTNLIGTWQVIQGFMDLLRQSDLGRIVNVSSGAGSFSDPVFGLLHHPQQVPVYGITKLALNGLTVKLAKQLQDEHILVNAVCPGWVATYPGTAEWGARPVEEGAKSIVWAATLEKDGPTGGFFRDGQPLSW